jgi:predicted transcriptional regulator
MAQQASVTTRSISSKRKLNKNKRMPQCQHPVEVEYWYVLPAIRRELAKSLKDNGKLKQKEISSILGISESAVSQYLKGTRAVLELSNGECIEMPEWLLGEINNSTTNILEQKKERKVFLGEVANIMNAIREKPKTFLCKIHQNFGSVLDKCNICSEAKKN